ncbi:hypothetical protein WUBG_06366, partial [Wuchereria bancrofti]
MSEKKCCKGKPNSPFLTQLYKKIKSYLTNKLQLIKLDHYDLSVMITQNESDAEKEYKKHLDILI